MIESSTAAAFTGVWHDFDGSVRRTIADTIAAEWMQVRAFCTTTDTGILRKFYEVKLHAVAGTEPGDLEHTGRTFGDALMMIRLLELLDHPHRAFSADAPHC